MLELGRKLPEERDPRGRGFMTVCHNDLDGVISAVLLRIAVVGGAFNYLTWGREAEFLEEISTDYNTTLDFSHLLPGDFVLFGDMSRPINIITPLLDKGITVMIWDHHGLNLIDHQKLYDAGTYPHFYLYQDGREPDLECGAELINKWLLMHPEKPIQSLGTGLSTLVRYVGDWDTWRWSASSNEAYKNEIKNFHSGACFLAPTPDKFFDTIDKLSVTMPIATFISKAVETGAILREAEHLRIDGAIKRTLRKTTTAVHLGEQPDVKLVVLNPYLINTPEVPAEICDLIKDYCKLEEEPLVFCWEVRVEKDKPLTGEAYVNVSVRCRDKNIHVGEICKVYGGGGHAGAGGFRMPFDYFLAQFYTENFYE